jgi:DNA-binding protein H-NS
MATSKRSYEQVLQQIEALKVEAEQLRRIEIAGVVERIREAISFYGLTAADLGIAGTLRRSSGATAQAAGKGRKKKSGAKAPTVVKYRNEAGGVWGGVGKRPQWLRDALASGKSLEDFLVK